MTVELREQPKEFARPEASESAWFDKLIWANLEDIGYGG